MNSTRNKPLILSESECVRAFIRNTGLPFNRAPEALSVSSGDFMAWWGGHKPKLIRYANLVSLGQYVHVDEEEIIEGTYDKDFVRSVLFDGPSVLPERYSQNQFSYLRSSAHILKYLTRTRGQHFSDKIMRKLNISPLIYANFNNKISLNYFVDLLEVLAENGLDQRELDSLACVLFLSLDGTPLGEKFKKAKTYYECYSVLSDSAEQFDTNFEYYFELSPGQVRIRAFLPFDKHTQIDWTQARIDKLLRYRQILMGCFPFLSKLPPLFPECQVEKGFDGLTATYIITFDSSLIIRPFSPANPPAQP